MKIVADKVYRHEPCYGYFTGPEMVHGYSEVDNPRMREKVFVVRGDTIACYERDFGPASLYPHVTACLLMPSDGENSVAEMQDWGEKFRAEPDGKNHIASLRDSNDFWERALTQEEQIHEILHNKTIIGPHVSIQRDGYSRARSERNQKAARQRRTGRIQL